MPKFCYNTWELFIRPNLDYANSYAYFVRPSDQFKLHTLYRTSLRRMLFIKNYVPNNLIDTLLKYSYKSLLNEFHAISNIK